jgi:UDP-2,3-diacylglucosamine pyrophosphatase LpxH
MSKKYDERIARGLEKAVLISPKKLVQKKDLKVIILSDVHKGQKDKADDFYRCKPAYHAALGYYYHLGFTLVLVGDVEELWECRPKKVVRAYADTLALEERFAKDSRYLRIWGNHDDYWEKPKAVRKLLGEDVFRTEVQEGVRWVVMDGDQRLGAIFLTHGHQGTTASEQFAWISKPFVRYVWRNIQRVTGIKSTTPAKNFELRRTHEMAMHQWANTKEKLILIAGHTHHPVFMARSHEDVILMKLSKKRKKLASGVAADEGQEIERQIAELNAELEWVLAKSNYVESRFDGEMKPCYFNTGCCSFSDGDITGIEIEQDAVRLVRWPDDDGAPRKKILAKEILSDIFNAC